MEAESINFNKDCILTRREVEVEEEEEGGSSREEGRKRNKMGLRNIA